LRETVEPKDEAVYLRTQIRGGIVRIEDRSQLRKGYAKTFDASVWFLQSAREFFVFFGLDQQISGEQELILQVGGRASGDNAEASQFGSPSLPQPSAY
jgi:hypothetical protein